VLGFLSEPSTPQGAVQFERSPGVKRKLGIEELSKSEAALREIDERGLS